MKNLLNFLIIVIKIVITVKVVKLLYITNTNPNERAISSLYWWVCLLIFDMWLMANLPNQQEN